MYFLLNNIVNTKCTDYLQRWDYIPPFGHNAWSIAYWRPKQRDGQPMQFHDHKWKVRMNILHADDIRDIRTITKPMSPSSSRILNHITQSNSAAHGLLLIANVFYRSARTYITTRNQRWMKSSDFVRILQIEFIIRRNSSAFSWTASVTLRSRRKIFHLETSLTESAQVHLRSTKAVLCLL